MRSLTFVSVAVLLLVPFSFAQQQQIQQMRTEAPSEQKKPAAPPRKLSKEEMKRATDLLESAESAAGAFQPATRALAYVQLARAYEITNRDKAVDLLEQAYTATQDLQLNTPNQDMNQRIPREIQQRVLRALVALSPARVDKTIDQLPVESRANVINAMLGYYRDHHDLSRAIDLVNQISDEAEMPYPTARLIMKMLGPDQQDELRQLFTESLASYQNHKHGTSFSTMDFPSMITEFYGKVPDDLVRQAIDEVLSQAKAADENAKQGDTPSIGVSSSQGAVQFNSIYQYDAFLLLPVIRKLDPERAKKILAQSADLQTYISKYPQGMSSLQGSKPGGGGNTMMTWSGGPKSGASAGSVSVPPGGQPVPPKATPPSMGEEYRSQQIVDDSLKHPNDALAAAITLSPNLRAQTYIGIARQNLKKDTSVAKTALKKAMDSLSDIPADQQVMNIGEIVQLYRQLGDTDSAKKAIEKGMDIAGKLYDADTDADDPNTAPKAYWPSTNAWKNMLDQAAAISPEWAVSLLKEIPDDDIRYYDQIGIAEGMLGVPRGVVETMTITKKSVSMMISSPKADE